LDGDTSIHLDLIIDKSFVELKTNSNNNMEINNININFKCYFQEICDFRIFFDDWGGANLNSLFNNNQKSFLINRKKKLKVEIKLLNSNGGYSETDYAEMNQLIFF
jgi:hypothetical protein